MNEPVCAKIMTSYSKFVWETSKSSSTKELKTSRPPPTVCHAENQDTLETNRGEPRKEYGRNKLVEPDKFWLVDILNILLSYSVNRGASETVDGSSNR